jgi:hypothetical protein
MPVKVPPRQTLLLAALLLALVAVVIYQLRGPGVAAPAGPVAAAGPAGSRSAAARDRAESAPEVRLSALKASKPAPTDKGRNLFRDQPKAPPPSVVTPTPPPPDPNAPPPPPPPPPPITLKLVGIVQGAGRPVAALTDGRDVFYGREGDVVEGRYKIIKINVESIDIAYLDGRGQRRLSLTG